MKYHFTGYGVVAMVVVGCCSYSSPCLLPRKRRQLRVRIAQMRSGASAARSMARQPREHQTDIRT